MTKFGGGYLDEPEQTPARHVRDMGLLALSHPADAQNTDQSSQRGR
jgi:hypothetical protein